MQTRCGCGVCPGQGVSATVITPRHRPIPQPSTTTHAFTAKYLTLCNVGSCLEVTDQLRATDMCLLHTGFLCSTIEPVSTSPAWTGTGSSIINSTCFQWVVLQDTGVAYCSPPWARLLGLLQGRHSPVRARLLDTAQILGRGRLAHPGGPGDTGVLRAHGQTQDPRVVPMPQSSKGQPSLHILAQPVSTPSHPAFPLSP